VSFPESRNTLIKRKRKKKRKKKRKGRKGSSDRWSDILYYPNNSLLEGGGGGGARLNYYVALRKISYSIGRVGTSIACDYSRYTEHQYVANYTVIIERVVSSRRADARENVSLPREHRAPRNSAIGIPGCVRRGHPFRPRDTVRHRASV